MLANQETRWGFGLPVSPPLSSPSPLSASLPRWISPFCIFLCICLCHRCLLGGLRDAAACLPGMGHCCCRLPSLSLCCLDQTVKADSSAGSKLVSAQRIPLCICGYAHVCVWWRRSEDASLYAPNVHWFPSDRAGRELKAVHDYAESKLAFLSICGVFRHITWKADAAVLWAYDYLWFVHCVFNVFATG